MKIYMGAPISGKTTTIETVMDRDYAMEHVIIEGEIIEMDEVRGPFGKDRNFLQKGAIWDGTSSMYFQFFYGKVLPLKKGQVIKMEGMTEKNKYTRGEYVFKATSIIEGTMKQEERSKDTAEEKRIELQTFSFMTALRGAVKADKLVERAVEHGHEAIAITDKMSVQAYPEVAQLAKSKDIRMIYGMTADVVDATVPIVHLPTNDSWEDATYVVFDVETTGFSVTNDHIIEIGAARFEQGVMKETFNYLVKSPKPIPEHIVELTGITNEMIAQDGVELKTAIDAFETFMQDAVLVAHNAQFDRDHLKMAFQRSGKAIPSFPLIDTLILSRSVNKEAKRHGLGALTKKYKIKLDNHHRACDDSVATGYVFFEMLKQMKDEHPEIRTVKDLNRLLDDTSYRNDGPREVTIWVRNQTGLKNLYRLISQSHTKFMTSGYGRPQSAYPVIPWEMLEAHREGLFLGSGSHLGKVFDYALNKTPNMALEEAKKFDVIEVQPSEIARHLWHSNRPETDDEEAINRAWKTVYQIGKKLNKPIVATGHVHYTDPSEAQVHNMIIYNEVPAKQRKHEARRGRMDYPQGACHLRTTEEMLDLLSWMGEEEAYQAVVRAPKQLIEQIDHVEPIPLDEQGNPKLFTPVIEGNDEAFRKMTTERAEFLYGSPLPAYVKGRLDKELDAIIGNGFAVIYTISRDLVKKSLEDGYLVGSRGSVGSSFAATMSEITEVNPLKPHYLCRNEACKWHAFFDHEELSTGYDLPLQFGELLGDRFSESAHDHFLGVFQEVFGNVPREKMIQAMKQHRPGMCPKCKEQTLTGEGQDIPFETFLGFKGDKVPDIDLNFSSVYQPVAHRYVTELFGEDFVFRAGTITTVAGKTAFAYVKNYTENHGLNWSNAEVSRWANRIEGAKRSTGQHPGGMLVVPDYMEMDDIGPFQFPADNMEAGFRTSHFDFHAIHDNILKLDILGHEAPTVLRYLQDNTGIDPRTVPPADPKVMQLFYEPEAALGIEMKRAETRVGTLGIPEMGTKFVQDMLVETKPRTFAELVKISGLSHGTDVWVGNAQELVNNETCAFKEVIGCRDDIMVYLMQKGLDPSLSFKIMEHVRKGKGLNEEWEAEMLKHDVPEWYIDSCNKIQYMFPKAHASAYVLDATRIGWYKVYKPLEYYSAIFSSRFYDADILEIMKPADEVRETMKQLAEEINRLMGIGEGNKAKKQDDLRKALNMALEAKERGIKFGKVRIYESHARRYLLDVENNELIPPFSSIEGIGETAAVNLYEEAQKGIFRGMSDFTERTRVNKTNVEVLRQLGCLEEIEEKQHVFF